jgi:hypothetical protein
MLIARPFLLPALRSLSLEFAPQQRPPLCIAELWRLAALSMIRVYAIAQVDPLCAEHPGERLIFGDF